MTDHYGLAVTLSRDALKGLFLLNGGAAAALIAFTGSVANRSNGINDADIGAGVVWFGIGAFFAISATIAGYFSQLAYANHIAANRSHTHHQVWQSVGIVLVLLSLLSGAWALYRSGQGVGMF
jgi:hypothetical protein